MQLAAAAVPELDRLLRRPRSASTPAAALQQNPASGNGEWTLLIRPNDQFARWEEIEKILRERFKSMQIDSIEIGADRAGIHLSGVDGDLGSALQGIQLRDGARLQINQFQPEARSLEVSIASY